jgi:hypothetical protein
MATVVIADSNRNGKTHVPYSIVRQVRAWETGGGEE